MTIWENPLPPSLKCFKNPLLAKGNWLCKLFQFLWAITEAVLTSALLGSKLWQWNKSIRITEFSNGEEKIGDCLHLFIFLSVHPVTRKPRPLSAATQPLLQLGTGLTGNFFPGSGACGLTFCNYPLLHLLMDYLTPLREPSSVRNFRFATN